MSPGTSGSPLCAALEGKNSDKRRSHHY